MKTNPIEKSIEQIRLLPGTQVDCGTDQGSDVFFSHLHKHLSVPEMLDLPFGWYVAETEKCLREIHDTIKPYPLPKDYLHFLRYYGGITISDTNFYFVTLGMGPMVEEWYSYLMAEGGGYANGLLHIGFIRYKNLNEEEWKYSNFLLDLGNAIKQNSVIELSAWKFKELDVQNIYNKPHSYTEYWSIISNSFTNWLELVANTGGTFNYINR